MNPDELRIGNFVYDYAGRIISIKTIEFFEDSYYITCNENHSFYCLNDMKPIQLTEECLRKLGIEIAQEILQQIKNKVQGVYLMPPFGRFEAALDVVSVVL